MMDSIHEETNSDKFIPDVLERMGSDKGNGKGKADSDTSIGKDLANDVHKDINHIEDTMKVAKSELGENSETKGGEGNDFDTFDELVDETCEEILQKKSNLNLHTQEMSDMSDCSQKGGSSDELTHDVLERTGDEEGDDENKLKSLARIEPANDVLKNDSYDNDTEGSANSKSGDSQESNKGENRRSNLYNAANDEACEKALKRKIL